MIIHLPAARAAGVPVGDGQQPAELADWIATVRGPTRRSWSSAAPCSSTTVPRRRPHERPPPLPRDLRRRPAQPEAARLDASAVRRGGRGRTDRPARERPAGAVHAGSDRDRRSADERRLLPAIVFIFSRNQCDEAARTCLDAGIRYSAPSATGSARSSRPGCTASDEDDLEALGYDQFAAQLEAGIAAHHAGMVPPFKEAVEACFVEGLIKVVFATETLAVGVNMPARTVVIEKLTKFTGEHHESLTAGEYTQLTGRAGRRGIDEEGHAIVLWSPFVAFEQVAALASSRTFHLRSVFRPTYNMAANLVGTYSSEEAHHLLNLSFAQYQSDRDVVRLEARPSGCARR